MGISRQQALDCFESKDLVGIGMEADAVRQRIHPEGMVSYTVEYSVGPPAADELMYAQIAEAVDLGGTGVRLVGGTPRDGGCEIEGLERVFRRVKERFPAVWVSGLSVAEILEIARSCGLGLRETIGRLRGAGLDSIAEDGVILGGLPISNGTEWVNVHRTAHQAGMQTAAAMVFGGGESVEQRLDFLEAVRRLQEETGGFTAFVPVSAEAPGGRELDGVTAVERLKTLAISRMFLDNVENVQASWTGQGLKVLQMGLRFGANDLGVVGVGGGSEEDLRRIIRDAGFRPVQRDPMYRTMFLN
jgi:cyclic dehypoxanthinyl futalosine synthase